MPMNNAKLQKIKDAWDKEVGPGREEERTREQARAYVKAHPAEFTELEQLTEDEAVKALEVFRDAGYEESEWRVQTWLFATYPPKQIGSTFGPVIDLPTEEVVDNG